LDAVSFGADALGFVFAKSPRQVTAARVRGITAAVGPWVATVGVFVNEKPARIRRIALECGLSIVQLHGDESPADVRALKGIRVIKAFRVGKDFDVSGVKRFPADAYLFDAKVAGQYGGTGKKFDWKILKKLKGLRKPMIVSGGLGPDNVKSAVRFLTPYGVEASSCVESRPGKKNRKLVKDFIRNAKSA
jgi:phosphoribosylanthranilate isomerase